MRHGHSPSPDQARVAADALRPLSPKGREDARRAAKHLSSRGGRPGLVLASPLTRAQQTAAEAASQFSPAPPVRTFEPLANQTTGVELVRRVLAEDWPETELLLVGHQPQLGEAASCLCREAFALQPGGVVAVEVTEKGAGRLLWAANPEDLPG